MITQILVAKGKGIASLAHQLLHAMLYQFGIAKVAKALRKAAQDTALPLHFPQQQSPCVRTDLAAVKGRHNLAPSQALKFEPPSVTVCLHEAAPLLVLSVWWHNHLYQKKQPFALLR